jgi:hypothetical protein
VLAQPCQTPYYYWGKGEAEYAARQYENAVATLRHEATYGTPSRSILAGALAQLGRLEEARIEARLFMADIRISGLIRSSIPSPSATGPTASISPRAIATPAYRSENRLHRGLAPRPGRLMAHLRHGEV